MENNFTQGGPRKMTAEEYKELTREKSAPPPSPVGELPKNTDIVSQSYVHELGHEDNPNKYPVSSFSFRQGAFWLKEILLKAGSASIPQSSTEEEKELWSQVLSDIINILYKSNGTGSGAIYVLKLLKSKYKISKR